MFLIRTVIIILFASFALSLIPAHATKLEISPEAPLWQHVGADLLLLLHIGGGALGMVAGMMAILSPKGQPIHRAAGNLFFVSMFVCYSIGAVVAPFLTDGQRVNFIAGVMALYLLITSWLAATRRVPRIGSIEYIGLVVAIIIALCGFLFMQIAANHPSGTVDGSPHQAFILFIIVGIISALGDMNVIWRQAITGVSRISRHLWRMCMSLFIATGSFFFGQEQVLPDWLVGSVFQSAPVFFPLVAIPVWLVLVRREESR